MGTNRRGWHQPGWAQVGANPLLSGRFIVQKADPSLPNAEALSQLANGSIIKVNVAGGVGSLVAATAGTDYMSAAPLADAEAYWVNFAASKLGTTAKQIAHYFIDFLEGARARFTIFTPGTSNNAPALTGGWTEFTAGDGTTHGTVTINAATINGKTPIHVSNGKTQPWLMVMRWRTTTTPGATARSTIGFLSDNFRAGIVKASNATKFCATFGATVLPSVVSFDTGIHELYARNDGTNVYLSVDGEAEVSVANTNLPTAAQELQATLFAGDLEAAQTFDVDYMGIFTLRS